MTKNVQLKTVENDDSRSQLVSAVKSLPGVPDESSGYLYDDIGNRTSSTEEGVTRAYTANCLNQYTAITNPSVSPTHDGVGSGSYIMLPGRVITAKDVRKNECVVDESDVFNGSLEPWIHDKNTPEGYFRF